MTVKELIDELSKHSPDASIRVTGCYGAETQELRVECETPGTVVLNTDLMTG